MNAPNSIFEKHYKDYLEKIAGIDLAVRCDILSIPLEVGGKTAVIPYFGNEYRVSCEGVLDPQGQRPDYSICVVLLKYLLLCPRHRPVEENWVNYRDLKDSGPLSVYFNNNVINAVSKRYSGRKDVLEAVASAGIGGEPDADYPYDVAAVIRALPCVPILLLFNDADDEFPAQTTLLFEKRAKRFLDAECLAMLAVGLFQQLKRWEKCMFEKLSERHTKFVAM